MKNKSVINYIIIGFFGLSLALPAFFGLIDTKSNSVQIENRRISELPQRPHDLLSFLKFPRVVDKYYEDHFGFRWQLLSLYRHMKFYLGDSPVDSAVFGNQSGWIFYQSKTDGDIIGDYRNINQFSKQQLQKAVNHIVHKQQWLQKQGIEYLFVIAPSKHYIYSEYLPEYLKPEDAINIVEQLDVAMADHQHINYLNLKPAILKDKSNGLLYYKADTHWNFYATNIAQYEMAKKINALIPNQLTPRLYATDEFTQPREIKGDMSLYLGLGEYFTEKTLVPKFPDCTQFSAKDSRFFTTKCQGSSLDALVFRDSYFSAVQPYFSQYFNQSTYIWQNMTIEKAQELITINKPDIVVEQWVDRYLWQRFVVD